MPCLLDHITVFTLYSLAADVCPSLLKYKLPSSALFFDQAIAGVRSSFSVQSLDRYGNRRVVGGDKVSAELTGRGTVAAEVRLTLLKYSFRQRFCLRIVGWDTKELFFQ